MRLGLSMGPLHIQGDYSLESNSVMEVIPLTNAGKISVIISEVYAEGQVGLTLGEKSLQATNFDMTYTPKNVIITVTYETNEGPAVSQVSREALDKTLVEKFREDLWYKLNLILQKELNYLLEFSPLARLLPDENLLKEFRNLTRGMTVIANKYIDDILVLAREHITQNNLEQVPVSNFGTGFSKKILFITWHGNFTAEKGWARDLATITRTSDMTLSYDKGTLSVFGSLGLRDLKVGFDQYFAKFMNIGPSGTLRATTGYNSVFIRAAIQLGINSTTSLENLRVDNIDEIDVKVTGLGILNWLTSKIVTWVLGFYNESIRKVVRQQLLNPLYHVLNDVNPNEYFM
ncbi:mite allergen Lep d 7 [Anabrus simplex]|uniref:mite allergen Lep d 7 n=1 Tax=Anabrus simplex TaxID=316456 RepID=UPI0035A2772C